MKLNNKNILALIASGFLFFALSSGLPYGYFTLMRFVVCSISIYLAYKAYEEDKESLWVWALGFVAVLFNPIFPIYLKRVQWEVIDLWTGVFFMVSVFFLKTKNDGSEYGAQQIKNISLWKQRTSAIKAVMYFYGAIAIGAFILISLGFINK